MPSSPSNPRPPENRPPVHIPDHVLLRRIGKGSYGEVWLARGLTGVYRAVKIVWRGPDEQGRSHDREFDGIQRYEQISRRHEGLVDVLHVGRAPAGDYFYYVMELADDLATNSPPGPNSPPDSYHQKTLRDFQKKAGRLPLQLVMEIAARLAAALSQLHCAGLVHRDIKPSNVIFVHDQPKLADIGLVAGMSEQCSFVGTEGFIAPEGPGTVEADIYSFGKLLYEMATGLDRLEFPRLPGAATAPEEVEEFAEVNEILLRACEKEPARRYGSAEELRRELLLLQGGRSVRKLRLMERRAALARKVSLIAAAAALVAIVTYFGSFRQFQRAQEAERRAGAMVEALQLQRAEEHFRMDDSSTALAILAHLVREDPHNHHAVERLLDALTWRNFALPRTEPMATAGRPRMALFNKKDTEIVSGTWDGNIELWDVATGRLKKRNKLVDGRIYWLDLSPDSKLAAIAGQSYATIVDMATLQPTIPLVQHSSNRVVAVQFSPNQRWFLTAGHETTARLWDVETGRQIGHSWEHESSVRTAAFSPDGTWAATGTRKGKVRLWEVATGRTISPVLLHTAIVWKVTFSPDGRLLATASDDHEARIWNARTGALHAVLRHKNCVVDVNFSPDGTKIVTASEDLTAMIWDVATGARIGNPLRHRNWVRQAAFSPDGQRVVTASEDNTTRIWDAETTEPLVEPMRHSSEVLQASFNHSGNSIVTTVSSASTGEELWLWDTATHGARGLPLLQKDRATAARFSLDGSKLAVACTSGVVRIWPRAAFAGPPEILRQDQPARGLAFSMDGRNLAVMHDTEVTVWDLATKQRIGALPRHEETISSVEFDKSGTRVLTASSDGTAVLWDAQTGERLVQYAGQIEPRGKRAQDILHASFSPDDSMIVTASRNERATVWRTATGEKVADLAHEHWVTYAEFSPDGRSVLTSSIDRSAMIWDIETGRQLTPPLTHDSDIRTAHFSGDGKKVVTTSMDWTARIWDAETGRPMSELLRHEGPAKVACFSPTSHYLITGADDGVVRLRDASTGVPVNDGFRHSSPIESVSFSPDGELVLVVPRDGDVTIYELNMPVFPAPRWLPELAEAVVGQRLGEDGTLQPTSPRRFFELRQQMTQRNQRGFYARWAAWFLQDSTGRTISPRSKIPATELNQRQIAMGTVEDLRKSLHLSPTNALTHALLARHYAADDAAPSSRRLDMASWHISHALSLDPSNHEIKAIQREVESKRLRQGEVHLQETALPVRKNSSSRGE